MEGSRNRLGRRWAVGGVAAAALALVAASVVLPGCGRGEPGQAAASGSLVIRGSDTMVNLSAAWAEAFMTANPGVQVSVSGGGSSTGFTALVDGSVDLANASRPIKDSERQALEAKGKPPVEHVVAYDAVTMIVNPANSVRSLTISQLGDILTGKVTNWRQVGGPDLAITVYSRETSSGTYAFVREHVMDNADYVSSARLMPSTQSIVEAVAQDKTGIGYVGLGYVTDAVAALAVAPEAGGEAVAASVETAADGTYALARPLFVYSADEPGELARLFIAFCTSETGRDIASEMGFVPAQPQGE